MHSRILSRCDTEHWPLLARMSTVRPVSIVEAFDCTSKEPLWFSKESDQPEGISRIRQEFEALRYLADWADELGIPKILEYWEDGQRVLLIRSVLAGNPYPIRLQLTGSLPELQSAYAAALSWLEDFRRLVPPPHAESNADLAGKVSRKLRDLSKGSGPLAGLASVLDQIPSEVRKEMGMVIHGDFFPMNILVGSDQRIRVIDWDAFGAGFKLQDVLTLVVGSNLVKSNGKAWDVDEIWWAIAFSDLPIATFLEDQARQAHLSKEDLAYNLYYFVGWQITDGAQMEQHRWVKTIEKLAARGFPQPRTVLSGLSAGIKPF